MVKKTNIVILSAPNPFFAAGIVAYDIYNALTRQGFNSIIMTNAYAEYSDKNIICLTSKSSFKREEFKHKILWHLRKWKLFPQEKIKKTNPDYYMFGLDQANWKSKAKKIQQQLPFKPDFYIYIFDHWFLNAKDLHEIYKNKNTPILWYMADMAPMTGGCHYTRDCKGYNKTCGNCPGLYSKSSNDQTHQNWKFKKEYLEKTDVRMIAGSEWQYQQLMECSLYKTKQKYKILLPIDESLFTPGDKNSAKKSLGIPVDKKIIIFGAFSVNETRKGFTYLAEALRILKTTIENEESENIFLIIAGKFQRDLDKSFPFPNKYLGFLSYSELSLAFQAADVYVCPSIEDSGPMMINQSIMSGTPVVSFEMGVALDLVITGETGYRAKLGDSEDLAKGIRSILKLDETSRNQMNINCREIALELLHLDIFASKIIEIINQN
jgi:glycosyltransferase involved in cell wall biosynthesis